MLHHEAQCFSAEYVFHITGKEQIEMNSGSSKTRPVPAHQAAPYPR